MLLSRPHAPVDDGAVPGSGAISFEAAVVDCPSVVRCFLMSGSDDYIVIVMARDIEDFERIHRTRTVPIAAGRADSIQFRDARGGEPGGAAGDFCWIAKARKEITHPKASHSHPDTRSLRPRSDFR
jgi:DNA-binding Lrp family transcriptional regulator